MFSAATDTDQRCEAQFYAGEWYLLKGNRTEAVPLLRQAEASCPKGFVEYTGAVAELRRLNP
jgi:lipoprotein NlpI